MSSRKFKFNTEISSPKLAYWFFFFSSAILFLCCGHNSDVSVKNISVIDLPFLRKPFITVSQLGHARYYHRDPQNHLSGVLLPGIVFFPGITAALLSEVFVCTLSYLCIIFSLSCLHPACQVIQVSPSVILHFIIYHLTSSFLVLKNCCVCDLFFFFLILTLKIDIQLYSICCRTLLVILSWTAFPIYICFLRPMSYPMFCPFNKHRIDFGLF